MIGRGGGQTSGGVPREVTGLIASRAGVATVLAMLAWAMSAPTALAAPPAVHIAGNQFADGSGHAIRLLGTTAGVGSAGACAEPSYGDRFRTSTGNVFYGPVDNRQLALMRSWHMTSVRVALNESCWLGLAPVRYAINRIYILRGRAGQTTAARVRSNYRRRMIDLVRRAHAFGFVTVVDLHYNAPGNTLAYGQWPLPDRDHSPAFWRSVATTFKHDRSMVFEVFNEPYSAGRTRVTWSCLRNGCRLPNSSAESGAPTAGCPVSTCPTSGHPRGSYLTAGMQELVNTIRRTGARQPLVVPGLRYANDLRQWLRYMPHDPLGQLGATFHFYSDRRYDNHDAGAQCIDVACWNAQVAPVAARVPVLATEIGQFDCRHDATDSFQMWADAHRVSYQPFGWYVADFPPCGNGADDALGAPAMLLDYNGTPSPEGAGFKSHFADLAAAGELP